MIGSHGSVAIPLFVDDMHGSLSDAFFVAPGYTTLMSYRYDVVLQDPAHTFSTLASQLIV